MYASRMFHSFGTVQSRTCVPDGDVVEFEWDPLPYAVQRFPDPLARDAPADRVQLLGDGQHLRADLGAIEVEFQIPHLVPFED